MICNKIRFNVNKYNINDFIYNVILFQKTSLKPAKFGEIDATKTIQKEYRLMCQLEKIQQDLEIDGELCKGETFLKIICCYFNLYNEIKKNKIDWYLKFENEIFSIGGGDIEKLNSQNNYLKITGKRISI